MTDRKKDLTSTSLENLFGEKSIYKVTKPGVSWEPYSFCYHQNCFTNRNNQNWGQICPNTPKSVCVSSGRAEKTFQSSLRTRFFLMGNLHACLPMDKGWGSSLPDYLSGVGYFLVTGYWGCTTRWGCISWLDWPRLCSSRARWPVAPNLWFSGD